MKISSLIRVNRDDFAVYPEVSNDFLLLGVIEFCQRDRISTEVVVWGASQAQLMCIDLTAGLEQMVGRY